MIELSIEICRHAFRIQAGLAATVAIVVENPAAALGFRLSEVFEQYRFSQLDNRVAPPSPMRADRESLS